MSEPALIVIGGSAGALDALAAIFAALPRDYPVPIAVVVHVPPRGRCQLATHFASRARLPLHEAEDKEPLAPPGVWFAPQDYHLLLEPGGTFALSVDPPLHFSRPAIDALFESAAEAFGSRLIGLLLSGASQDGAAGLARIRQAGGLTLVQSPETALTPVMPGAALTLDPAHEVVALDAIGPRLLELVAHREARP